MLKLLIADDEIIIRKRLVTKLDWNSVGFEVIGVASDGNELFEKTINLKPDAILTDIKMPHMDGIEFAAKIKKENISVQIVILSGYAEFEYARTAMSCGVYSYILKPLNKDEIYKTFKELRDKIEYEKKQNKQNQYSVIHDYLIKNILFCECEKELIKAINSLNTEKAQDNLGCMFGEMINIKMDFASVKDTVFLIFNLIYRNLKENSKINDKVKYIFLELFEEMNRIKDENSLRNFISAKIEAIFCEIHNISVSSVNIYLEKALSYIESNFIRDISLEEVAFKVGVSAGYLSAIFKEENSIGFVKCLKTRRLEEAKHLLKETDQKIYEVAENSGFRNARYFSEVFKTETALTPYEYRNIYRSTRQPV